MNNLIEKAVEVIGNTKKKSKIEKIGRDAFLFFTPPFKETEDEFAQCSTCRMAVPAAKLDGIGPGDKCIAHGSKFKIRIKPGSCGLYAIWPDGGKPDPEVVKNHAKELSKGLKPSVTHKESGYVERPVRCMNCEYFEEETITCGLYKMLNKLLPKVFNCDPDVKTKYSCCNANTADTDD